MRDAIAGIRFTPNGPLVFCHAGGHSLERGQRVRVEVAGSVREGVIAIAPDQFIAAPPLVDAPRVVEVIAGPDTADPSGEIPAGITFLPADDSEIGLDDLARALRLAALPVPDPPEERRSR